MGRFKGAGLLAFGLLVPAACSSGRVATTAPTAPPAQTVVVTVLMTNPATTSTTVARNTVAVTASTTTTVPPTTTTTSPPTAAPPTTASAALPIPVNAETPTWSSTPVRAPKDLVSLKNYWYAEPDWKQCVMFVPTAPTSGNPSQTAGYSAPTFTPGTAGGQPPISWQVDNGGGVITEDVYPAGQHDISPLNDFIASQPRVVFYTDGTLELFPFSGDGSSLIYLLPGQPCLYMFTFTGDIPQFATRNFIGTLGTIASTP